MSDDRLSREQEQAMRELFEKAALNDYPNPTRIGCPGRNFLEQLNENRQTIQLSDPRLDHVSTCSPCFRELAAIRSANRRGRLTRRALWTGSGVIAAGMTAVAVKWPKRGTQIPLEYELFVIDLSGYSSERGADTPSLPLAHQPVLLRKRLDLLITLPFASQEGQYEVQILRANGSPSGVTASGEARMKAGKTVLEVKMDLTRLSPDRYQLGIRRIPFDWMPVPVNVR